MLLKRVGPKNPATTGFCFECGSVWFSSLVRDFSGNKICQLCGSVMTLNQVTHTTLHNGAKLSGVFFSGPNRLQI